MKLTKFGHSCIRLEKDSGVLVFDPGTESDVAAALSGATAILITHEHADHFDAERVLPFLESNEKLEIYAPPSVAASIHESASEQVSERVRVPHVGEPFEVAGFNIQVFGGQHALIHPLLPVVANYGYLVDGDVFHPGDSFTVPETVAKSQLKVLLVPFQAPWSKTSEVIDFVISVRPARALPIHDAMVNDRGRGVIEKHVKMISARFGTSYEALENGVTLDLA